MGAIVLVHGAWQGAWCWARTLPRLDDGGHVVVAPTLRGSGERADELDPQVGLADHVADVAAALEGLDEPAVLVVHSYAGMLPAGVVARCGPDAVGAVVFVDSFYPDEGESAFDQMLAGFPDLFRQRAAEEGDGWRLPPDDALLDVWGLHDPADRRWVRAHLTDWSVRCFESPSAAPRSVLAGSRAGTWSAPPTAPPEGPSDRCRIGRRPTGARSSRRPPATT